MFKRKKVIQNKKKLRYITYVSIQTVIYIKFELYKKLKQTKYISKNWASLLGVYEFKMCFSHVCPHISALHIFHLTSQLLQCSCTDTSFFSCKQEQLLLRDISLFFSCLSNKYFPSQPSSSNSSFFETLCKQMVTRMNNPNQNVVELEHYILGNTQFYSKILLSIKKSELSIHFGICSINVQYNNFS